MVCLHHYLAFWNLWLFCSSLAESVLIPAMALASQAYFRMIPWSYFITLFIAEMLAGIHVGANLSHMLYLCMLIHFKHIA